MAKALSIMEPWATLIKEGVKHIETRSWKTSYRGELYIHASAKKIKKSDPEIAKLLKFIPNSEMSYGKNNLQMQPCRLHLYGWKFFIWNL